MAVERKCLQCGTWNKDNDFCIQCSAPVSPIIIEEKREEKREEIRRNKIPSKVDIFIENWKNSRFWILRALYKILYTIAVIFFSIAGFFAWLSASPNG
jgi:hypothetical protein